LKAKFRRYYRLVSGAIIDQLEIRFQPTWGGQGSILYFEAVDSIHTRRKERKKAYF